MKYSVQDNDEQLILGCKAGDRLAQRYLYERYAGRMMSIPMRYVRERSEALEILNTAFCKAFQSIHQYQPVSGISGWLAKIVFYTTIDFVRNKISNSKSITYIDNIPDEDVTPNDALNDLAVEELFVLVHRLPPATQAVFTMYAIDGYKHQEIADMLNISLGTSKWHVAEARNLLQKSINSLNFTKV